MNFNERPLIITDLETSGLNPRKYEIIEIGAIKINPQTLEILNNLNLKVKLKNSNMFELKALEINGYTEEAWANAIPLRVAMLEYDKFAQDGILTAWNTTFEYSFLDEAYYKLDMKTSMDYHRLDVPSMVWLAYPFLEKLNQDAVCKYLNIEKEPMPHRAINGAYQTLQVLRALRDSQYKLNGLGS